MKRILIIGGTGYFGKKLCLKLGLLADIELIITSRSQSKADDLARELSQQFPQAVAKGIALDHKIDLAAQLKTIAPDITVDCSGPFQTANYDVATAVIESGSNFVDFADAPDYLDGFQKQLSTLAHKHGVTAITGASTSPALSGAIVNEIVADWRRVDDIEIAMAPGGKGVVGASAIAATLTYAGRKVPTWSEGQTSSTIGWGTAKTVDMPIIGPRQVSPVETYDSQYLSKKYRVTSSVSFHAGLESSIEQFSMQMMGIFVRFSLPLGGLKMANLIVRLRKLTNIFTSDRGCINVVITGLDGNNKLVSVTHTLIAENNDGPNIPALPALAAVKHLLAGDVISGAYLAPDILTLEDIKVGFEGFAIRSVRNTHFYLQSIYHQKLGAQKFNALPSELRDFHDTQAYPVWHGGADIETGSGILPTLISNLFGFPKAGKNVPLTVSVERGVKSDGVPFETWTRNFDGRIFSSQLSLSDDGFFREQFGPLSFVIGLDADIVNLVMPVQSWRLLTPFGAIALPLWLAPKSETREYQDEEGRFRFDVKLSLPLIGLLAHYKGWLKSGDI